MNPARFHERPAMRYSLFESIYRYKGHLWRLLRRPKNPICLSCATQNLPPQDRGLCMRGFGGRELGRQKAEKGMESKEESKVIRKRIAKRRAR